MPKPRFPIADTLESVARLKARHGGMPEAPVVAAERGIEAVAVPLPGLLGKGLFDRAGYTRALLTYKADNRRRVTPFNPDAPMRNESIAADYKARYGVDITLVDGGALEGGAIRDPYPELLTLLGLPADYQWTWLDREDAACITKNGQTWACDDALLAPVTPPDPDPGPGPGPDPGPDPGPNPDPPPAPVVKPPLPPDLSSHHASAKVIDGINAGADGRTPWGPGRKNHAASAEVGYDRFEAFRADFMAWYDAQYPVA